jgi:hypothetical protein
MLMLVPFSHAAGPHVHTIAMRAGAVSSFPLPPALPPGGNYAPLGEALHIQGQAMSAWVFDTPGSVPDVASWLTARQPALRDMWVMPGAAVLAGTAGDMQWAARLFDAGGGRTRGILSALSLSAAAPTSSAGSRWRPKGAQLRFELRSREESAMVVEQVWTHDAPPATLSRQLYSQLLAEGWQQADARDPSSGQTARDWSRDRMNLSMVIVPLDQGSGITTVLRITG